MVAGRIGDHRSISTTGLSAATLDVPAEQPDVPAVRPEEDVEEVADERERPDGSVQPHVQRHSRERRPRNARQPRFEDDVQE